MAFVAADFQCISPACPKVFLYRTNDANAVVEAASYFDSVTQLSVGDLIIVAGDLDGTPESYILTILGVGVTTTIDLQTNS